MNVLTQSKGHALNKQIEFTFFLKLDAFVDFTLCIKSRKFESEIDHEPCFNISNSCGVLERYAERIDRVNSGGLESFLS